MTKTKIVTTLFILSLAWLASCSKERVTSSSDGLTSDCKGCHTDEAKLKALAVPDSSSGSEPGEG
jgi:hypothetical protein